MIRRCYFPVRPLASSSSPGFKMLQNISKKVVQIQTKTRRWVVLTNWRQLKMPGERNIYRMKRKGEIFTVDKNKPLPEILNCTLSLAWAVTPAQENRSSVMASLNIVDSFMENFRPPPGSICVKEVSGGLSPSSEDLDKCHFWNRLTIWNYAVKCLTPHLVDSPSCLEPRLDQTLILRSQLLAPAGSDETGRTCPPGLHITQQAWVPWVFIHKTPPLL